jgi:diadenosine tetraphosphate (Ap4A) HIT family hydrolase
MVLVARRHSESVADLTVDEANELGPLIKRVSGALREVLGCAKTYVIQFAEHPDHPHVHFHVIPRHPEQPAELRGPRIFQQLGLPDEHCVTESRRDEIASQLRERLSGSGSTDAGAA